MQPIRLTIHDIASAGALQAVENALRLVPGVISVRPDPAGHDVLVEAGENVNVDDLVAAVQKAGYVATVAC